MMKWPYPVGTRVKISPLGYEKYGVDPSNPPNTVGCVTVEGESWTTVRWNNGNINSYQTGTIYPVQVNLDNI